jgi:ADP-heptose:LPS heptosyltransferase
VLIARLDNLGDVLLATPAIHALRRALPTARFTLFASPVGAQVAALNPDLDDALEYRAPWMDPDRRLPQDPAREGSILAELRRGGYDGAIIFTSYHQSPLPTAYLGYLAGIPLRHAASIDGPGSLLTSRHRHPDRMMHEVERGLDLVGGLGVPPAADDLVLRPREEDRLMMRELVRHYRRGGRPVIVAHPGCTQIARTYPPDLFAEAANAIRAETGAQFIWTGADHESDLVARIQRDLDEPGLNLAGQTDLSQLAALIAACDLALTNNTGPMHVAAAVKTPVAVFFALTNPPEQWRPWKVPHRLLYRAVPCQICYQRICPYGHECLRDVTIPEIVGAVVELLEEARALRGEGSEALCR